MSHYTDSGPWQTVTVAQNGTASSETDLKQEYAHVQVYVPALDSSTVTVQVSRVTGDTAVQAYGQNVTATGGYTRTTTARTSAGMEVFKDLYARYVTILCGAAQNTALRTFYVRGIGSVKTG